MVIKLLTLFISLFKTCVFYVPPYKWQFKTETKTSKIRISSNSPILSPCYSKRFLEKSPDPTRFWHFQLLSESVTTLLYLRVKEWKTKLMVKQQCIKKVRVSLITVMKKQKKSVFFQDFLMGVFIIDQWLKKEFFFFQDLMMGVFIFDQ